MTAVMQPTGREISAAAFAWVRQNQHWLTSRNRVLSVLCCAPRPLTRHDIAEYSGMPINVVCPRVRELLDTDAIDVVGTVTPEHGPARQLLAPTAEGHARFGDIAMESLT